MHLALTLYVLNFLNVDAVGKTAAERFWAPDPESFLYARWKDVTGQWPGPDPVLRRRGRGFACIFPQNEEIPRWLPLRCIRFTKENGPPLPATTSSSTGPDGETPEEKGEESPIAYLGTNKKAGISASAETAEASSYWAFMVDPPFVQPLTWDNPTPHVPTNLPDALGGLEA
ncbi:Gag-Pro-Pol polyprotein [Vulpes lagopus]